MKKILLLLLLSLQHSFAGDKINNIPNLFESDIESAKTKAKTEHKGVFVLYYADWCGFCQKIFNETLPDEAVQRALKAGFACYKIQNSTDEGNEFKAKYDIRSLPTLLFFDEKGELVLKQAGMQTKAKLFATINKVYEDYYQKDKPREFSFTPSILPPKSINFFTKFDKSLAKVEEPHTQTIIGSVEIVPCTGTGSCNDGNACTTGDVCVNSVCVGQTPVVCNDGNSCTDDACNVISGCIYSIDNTNTCSDNSVCTQTDVCSNGICLGSNPVTCAEDNNPCTTASCNNVTGCGFINNTNACNDGNACTQNDVCSNGVCQSGPNTACNDGNVCTNDACNPSTGACTYTSNTASCNDGNACTVNDVCANNSCQAGTPRVCNDNNACTDDSCSPATGCIFTNDNTNTCTDNNVCTINDQCTNGGCAGTDITSTCPEDNNPCTTRACNSSTGCYLAYNTNACDDGDPNTTGDVCSLGNCVGQPIPSFGEMTPSGITIPKLGAFPTCSATKKSFMFYHTGQNLVYVCDGNNWTQLDNSTSAVFETVLASTTQTITGSNTAVTIDFGTPLINVGNRFDASNNVFTADKDGFYHFDVSTCLTAISGIVLTIEIVDQNGNVLANQRTTSTNTTQLINCSVSKKLLANDSVKVNIKQSDTQGRTISQSCTRFSGYRVY